MILITLSLISKFPLDHINSRTPFVGLENNIPNSYLNAEVFFLWSLPAIRTLILVHTCSDPLCLSCELKFLFRMFDQGLENGLKNKPQGTVVHATNFYRMLAHRPDSIAFGILDDPDGIPALYE